MEGRTTLPLVVIAGPTGVGKTATALALARRVGIEVISADSRQVYRGMDVATGKPTHDERRSVPHHLIDVVDPDDPYQAARFRRDATRIIEEVRGRQRLPTVVGGTGLYLRALVRGLDGAPPADPVYRRELADIAVREGRVALHRRLAATAPDMACRLHPNDHVRVIRALEVRRAGGPSTDAPGGWATGVSAYDVVAFGLTMDRTELARRLRTRAEAMVANGLMEEVARLLGRGYAPSLPAMNGIGYREFVRVAQGTLTPAEALRLMQRDTVRYAKRQWTWFLREPDFEWLDLAAMGGPDRAAVLIEERLRRRGVIE